MKSLKLIAKGRVQRVGYRNYIDSIAFELEVKGYVKNLEDGTVEIVGQHEQDAVLEDFAEKAKISEYPISVTHIKKEYVDVPPFEKFEIQRGDPIKEQSERLDEAAFYLMKVYGSNKEILGSSKEILGSSKEILESNKEIASKIDVTNNSIQVLTTKTDKVADNLDSFANATMQRFDTVDKKYGKVSDNLIEISGSLKELVEILKVLKPKS